MRLYFLNNLPHMQYSNICKGGGIFGEKNLGTCHVVVNCHECHGTPNPKFHFGLLLFHLAQGLTVPQQILPVTLKSAKQSLKMYLTFLNVAPEKLFISLFKS